MWEYNQGPDSNDYLKHYGVKGMKWDPEKLKRKGQYAYNTAKGGYAKVKKNARAAVEKAYGNTTYGKASARVKKYTARANKNAQSYNKSVGYNPFTASNNRNKRKLKNYKKNAARAEVASYAKLMSSPTYRAKTAVNKARKKVDAAKGKVRATARKAISASGKATQYYTAKSKVRRTKAAATSKISSAKSKVKSTAKYVKNTPARIKGKQELKKFVKRQKGNSFYARQADQAKRNKTILKKRKRDRKQRNK